MPDESQRFFREVLIGNWPRLAELHGIEFDLFCERLRPFTEQQALVGVKALLGSDDRRFKPTVKQLVTAIIDNTGPGRDVAFRHRGRQRARSGHIGQHHACLVCGSTHVMQPFATDAGDTFRLCRACCDGIWNGAVPLPSELIAPAENSSEGRG